MTLADAPNVFSRPAGAWSHKASTTETLGCFGASVASSGDTVRLGAMGLGGCSPDHEQ